MTMQTIEWDLTPSWWGSAWWLQHFGEPSISPHYDEYRKHRSPMAVAYAIEEVLRWVSPRATVVASNTSLIARFDIESEAMFVAQLADERARKSTLRTPEEARLAAPKSLEELRRHTMEWIEDIVSAKRHPFVKPGYPHLNFAVFGGCFSLEVSGLRSPGETFTVCREARVGESDESMLRGLLSDAVAVLDRRSALGEERPAGPGPYLAPAKRSLADLAAAEAKLAAAEARALGDGSDVAEPTASAMLAPGDLGISLIVASGEDGAAEGARDAAVDLGIAHAWELADWRADGKPVFDGQWFEGRPDATVVFVDPLSPVHAATMQRLERDGLRAGGRWYKDRPAKVIDPIAGAGQWARRAELADWLASLWPSLWVPVDKPVRSLHVVGAFESEAPGIAAKTRSCLVAALSLLRQRLRQQQGSESDT